MGMMDAIQAYFTRNDPQPQPTPQQAAVQSAMMGNNQAIPYAPGFVPPPAAPAPKKKAPMVKKMKAPMPAPASGPSTVITQPVIQTPPSPQEIVANMQNSGLQVPDMVQGKGWHSTIEGTGTQEDINSNKQTTTDQVTAEDQQRKTDEAKDMLRKAGLLDDDQMAVLEDRANRLGIKSMSDQNAGLAQIRAGVDQYKHIPTQLDLSPLAALVDAQTGSKFSQTYKVPDGARKLAAENIGADTGVQKLQNEFTKDQLALLRSQIQGYQQNQIMKSLVDSNLNKNVRGQTDMTGQVMKDGTTGKVMSTNVPEKSNSNKPQINNEMEKLWTGFRERGGKTIDAISEIPKAESLLNAGTTISDSSLATTLVRMSGDDKVSDADINARTKGDRNLTERVSQMANWAFGSGSFTPHNQAEVRQLLHIYIDAAKSRYEKLAAGFADSAKSYQPTLTISRDQVLKNLYDRSGYKKSDIAPAPQKKSLMDEYKEFKKAGG